ncbi:MAG: phospho-sugar mutase [Opitutaceae bacterium]|jgi:phosphoglucomutase|nr:phospho-sugar mutase [Opitutaceae bacterium]
MNTPLPQIEAAARAGQLLPSSLENLRAWLAAPLPEWARASIGELVGAGDWAELNNRFYRHMEFGTGGIRGRTIGASPTAAELGRTGPFGTPEHAGVGSNILNDFNLLRAVMGLFAHVKNYLAEEGRPDVPALVIAHDVRHFSRHFCELAASAWTRLGGQAFIFDGPRPTPQLSFSVRHLRAHAGVVITASHNPPHDNGFKAYFEDGAQVVAPHDAGIVAEVNKVPLEATLPFLDKDLGRVVTLGRKADEAYRAAAMRAVIDPSVFGRAGPRVAFTNIHGAGGVAAPALLEAAGCEVHCVAEQAAFDPRFPTVKSPNPENPEALALAVRLAETNGLDAVMATDPDCDRMGVAVRGRDGRMALLTGNQVGCLLADYRLSKLKETGMIPPRGSDSVVLVTTFVTTRLMNAIGAAHGVRVISTLTGFKWIAAKLRGYEERLKKSLLEKTGMALDYDATEFATRAWLLREHSAFYAFGCEESYGYLPNDLVRDKDGNAACLMFAELCAWVKNRGLTVPEYLDGIYLKHGFHAEDVINLYYEGASGAEKIRRILDSYRDNPPAAFGDVPVRRFNDFGRQVFKDADGEVIPKQDLYIVELANGHSFAARGSGTEPKMKFYLFASGKAADARELGAVKERTRAELARLKALIEADAKRRAEG